MNESITRAAGASHGEEMPPAAMDALIRQCGREPSQRTTLYGEAPAAQIQKSYDALALVDIVNTPVLKKSKTDCAKSSAIASV